MRTGELARRGIPFPDPFQGDEERLVGIEAGFPEGAELRCELPFPVVEIRLGDRARLPGMGAPCRQAFFEIAPVRHQSSSRARTAFAGGGWEAQHYPGRFPLAGRIMRRVLIVLLAVGSATAAASEDPFQALALATRYEIGDDSVRIVSDRIVEGAGVEEYRFSLSAGSAAARARAADRASGTALSAAASGDALLVSLGRTLGERAERRVRIEELVDRSHYVRRSGDGLLFEHLSPPGRIVVLLPSGTVLRSASVPVQTAVEDGRLKLGILNPGPERLPLRLEFGSGEPGAGRGIEGDFRADDERNIVYWLEDPAEHRIRLALELLLDAPGQAHVFSVLLPTDRILDPVTLDVDRGVELPTRIVSAEEAAAIPHAPMPLPDDASVLVADLGYAVPEGGNARVRLYQTAINPGYELLEDGDLRLLRFLARPRTRIVLPGGWDLTSLDQPAFPHRDDECRLFLDFVHAGGDRPSLVLTATRAPG